LEHPRVVGKALQDYKLLSIFKKQVYCYNIFFKEIKNSKNPYNNEGNDQVDNKETMTNNKTM
jgi:hypothetical protein